MEILLCLLIVPAFEVCEICPSYTPGSLPSVSAWQTSLTSTTIMGLENISNDHDTNKVMGTEGEKAAYAPPPAFEGDMVGEMSEAERNIYDHGIKRFNRLGWKRLTIVLIVEAIALGSLSIPSTFATLGMVPGVICCVGIGLIAIYTSYVVGMVKLAFPEVANYADAGRLLGRRLGCGRFGYELVNGMLGLQLIFLTASHCLTGTIAFLDITKSGICSIIFAVVSAIILLLLAIPPSFTEVAILGYVDFASIIIAIGITIIGTGVQATHSPDSPESHGLRGQRITSPLPKPSSL